MTADDQETRLGEWRRLALAALRRSGTAGDGDGPEQVEELLAARTYDGLRIPALQTAETTELPPFPYVRGARDQGGWDVRQRHTDGRTALTDLENGATSLWLVTGGLDWGTLDGILLDLAPVVLDSGPDFPAAGAAWFALLAARDVDPAAVSGGFGADPLGWRARTGDPSGLPGALRDAAALAGRCVAEAPGLRTITVDATLYHDAGAADAFEVACAAAAGVAYLRALTDAGLSVADALGQLEFRFAATADQFATIAKLRAARQVWARIAELSGAADAGVQRQHAVTSAAMMTARDPWVNLLRATVAAFAAGVGGADAVTVLPFDHRIGQPDAFALRLARNTQLLLLEEAHVAKVVDPAAGSWYVERYTSELAGAAWDAFTGIERAGGFAAALDGGLVAGRLGTTWQERRRNIAHRRDPITGVSSFPDLDEKPLRRRPAVEPAGGGLPRHHYAEDFERLRDRSAGHRPTVLLVTVGSPAAYGAQVTFATNLFAAGGIAVTTERGDGPLGVVCVCGPEPDAVVAELYEAGAKRVLVAGPGDAVAFLTGVLDDLGVPQ